MRLWEISPVTPEVVQVEMASGRTSLRPKNAYAMCEEAIARQMQEGAWNVDESKSEECVGRR